MERNQICAKILGDTSHAIHPVSFYQWFPVPKPCTGKLFEALLSKRGGSVYGSERFSLGDAGNGSYIRIATSSPGDVEMLEHGFRLIRACCQELQKKEPDLIV